MSMDEKGIGTIETWAIVEVMGHNRYAGFCRSVSLGAGAMIRIDVPEIPESEIEASKYDSAKGDYVKVKQKVPAMQGFTKFLGVASIFAITPCSEEFARAAVQRFRSAPVTVIEMPSSSPRLEFHDED